MGDPKRALPGFGHRPAEHGTRAALPLLAVLAAFCLLAAVTLPVNPFPSDGWFESQYRIFRIESGGDNYSPVAAPAFLYAAIHTMAAVFEGDLADEFYLISVVQNLLIAATGWLCYLTLRRIGLSIAGLAAAVATVLILESSLMAQAAWSEPIYVFLLTAAIALTVLLRSRPPRQPWVSHGATVILGLTLGIAIASRFVPIVLVPAVLLFVGRRAAARRRPFLMVLGGTVIMVLLSAMTANFVRFGRFELSNSVGRHLWNATTDEADQFFGGIPLYERWKESDPQLQGTKWWDLPGVQTGELPLVALDRELRGLTLCGMRRRPFLFLEQGLRRSWLQACRPPPIIGRVRSTSNPLASETVLPPLIGGHPNLEAFLDLVNFRIRALYPVAALLGLATLPLGLVLAFLPATRSRVSDTTPQTMAFLAFALLATTYLTAQIESDPRYVLHTVPFVVMIVAMLTATAVQGLRRLGTTYAASDNEAAARSQPGTTQGRPRQ